jgi:mono/diheme cytochrome c family protein
MFEFLKAAIPLFAACLLAWSSRRAWRAGGPWVKWGGGSLAALASVAFAAVGVLLALGLWKLHARSAPRVIMHIASTADQIQRGHAIADGFCSGCHSTTGTLTGGLDLGTHIAAPIGSFVAANITPAGVIKTWSDGDIFRAIRNSVDHDGNWLIMMSFTNASSLSDDDTRAVIAYLRSLPSAGRPTAAPPDHLSLLGLAMLGAGMLPTGKPVSVGVVSAPPKGPTLQFGEYILSYQDCRQCHGSKLTGGVPGQLGPLGPDLNLVKGWNFEQFVATLRTGIDPNGHAISIEMPWQPIGRMDDDELRAIYEYLTHLPNG